MRQRWCQGLLVIAMLSAGAPVVLAVDQGGQSMERKDAPASASSAQLPSPSAPAAPMPPVSAPTSSTSTSQTSIVKTTMAVGSITALDLMSTPPSLKLIAADGKIWTLTLDPKATLVWQNGQVVKLDQLKIGEQVSVRYLPKDGKEVAQSIRVVQQLKQATPSAPSSTTSH